MDKLVEGTREKEFNHYKDEYKKTVKDFEGEVENQGSIPRPDLETHITEYKSKVKALNKEVDTKLDVGSVEEELKGQPREAKALMWKEKYMELLQQSMTETVGESRAKRFLEDLAEIHPWVGPFMIIAGSGITLAIILRILNLGGGGGGLGALGTIGGWVKKGVYGAKDVLEDADIEEDEVPEEEESRTESRSEYPTPPYNDVTVTGSARGAAAEEGLASDVLYEMARIAGIAVDASIALSAAELELLAGAADVTVSFLVNNPSKAILIALTVVCVAILAVNPIPGSRPAAAGLASASAGALGIQAITIDEAKAVAPQIRLV